MHILCTYSFKTAFITNAIVTKAYLESVETSTELQYRVREKY